MPTVAELERQHRDLSYLERSQRPRGRMRRILVAFALLVLLVYSAPKLLALTSLRNVPLGIVLEGIEGTITSQSASLSWFSPVVYRGVEVRDREGELVLTVGEVTSEKTAAQILADRSRLGGWTIDRPQVFAVARADGSNLEDVFLPWWNTPSSGPKSLVLQVNDGEVLLQDPATGGKWQIAGLKAMLDKPLDDDEPLAWSAEGEVVIDAGPGGGQQRSTFAVSTAGETRDAIAITTERLPLGLLRSAVARAYPDVNLRGWLTANIEYSTGPSMSGKIACTELSAVGGPLGHDTLHLSSVEAPFDVSIEHDHVHVRQLQVTSDVGQGSLSGEIPLGAGPSGKQIEAAAHGSFKTEGTLDLARLARLMPELLKIREGVQVGEGTLAWNIASQRESGGHRWTANVKTSALGGTSGGRAIRWDNPVTLAASIMETANGLAIERLDCDSSFLRASGRGTPDDLTASLEFDLDRLAGELGQFIDLPDKLRGQGRAELGLKRTDDGSFRATVATRLSGVEVAIDQGRTWKEQELTAELQATGVMRGTAVERLDSAELHVTATGPRGKPDLLEVTLRERLEKPQSLERLPVLVHFSGELGQWQTRLAPVVDLSAWDLSGTTEMHLNVTRTAEKIEIHSAQGAVQQLHAHSALAGWFIDEPVVQFKGQGEIAVQSGSLALRDTVIEANTFSVTAPTASISVAGRGSLGLLGQVEFAGDLEKLHRWTVPPGQSPPLMLTGRLSGRTDLKVEGDVTAAKIEARIDDFAAIGQRTVVEDRPANLLRRDRAARVERVALWQEKQIALGFRGQYDRRGDAAKLESLELASNALRIKAAGGIGSISRQANLDLRGEITYDWETLSPVLRPYIGDDAQFEGRETRQFAVRGPVQGLFQPPATAGAPGNADSFAWIKPLTAQAGVGWDRAQVFGLAIDRGEIATELADGVLKVTPIDLAVSEGRVRLAPSVRLTPGPAELTLPRGRVIERVRVTPQMTAGWLKYIAPTIAEATRTEGTLSLELEGARVPLMNPDAADIGGRLEIHSLEVTPSPSSQQLVLLIEQIRAIVERRPPPAELGRNPVLLSMSEQKVDFRMVEGRVHHQGLAMRIGDVTVRTRGWVAMDQTIGLVAEVPILDRWVANDPLLAGLKGQVLEIPIEGTLRQWNYQRALQQLAAQIVQKGAGSIIEQQLNRQLDRLFQPR
jgi:hypothetical protein